MIAYLAVGTIIAILGAIGYTTKYKKTAIASVLLILILFAGLRGDFTTDYRNYGKEFKYRNDYRRP